MRVPLKRSTETSIAAMFRSLTVKTGGRAAFLTSGLHPGIRLATASDTTLNRRRFRWYTRALARKPHGRNVSL